MFGPDGSSGHLAIKHATGAVKITVWGLALESFLIILFFLVLSHSFSFCPVLILSFLILFCSFSFSLSCHPFVVLFLIKSASFSFCPFLSCFLLFFLVMSCYFLFRPILSRSCLLLSRFVPFFLVMSRSSWHHFLGLSRSFLFVVPLYHLFVSRFLVSSWPLVLFLLVSSRSLLCCLICSCFVSLFPVLSRYFSSCPLLSRFLTFFLLWYSVLSRFVSICSRFVFSVFLILPRVLSCFDSFFLVSSRSSHYVSFFVVLSWSLDSRFVLLRLVLSCRDSFLTISSRYLLCCPVFLGLLSLFRALPPVLSFCFVLWYLVQLFLASSRSFLCFPFFLVLSWSMLCLSRSFSLRPVLSHLFSFFSIISHSFSSCLVLSRFVPLFLVLSRSFSVCLVLSRFVSICPALLFFRPVLYHFVSYELLCPVPSLVVSFFSDFPDRSRRVPFFLALSRFAILSCCVRFLLDLFRSLSFGGVMCRLLFRSLSFCLGLYQLVSLFLVLPRSFFVWCALPRCILSFFVVFWVFSICLAHSRFVLIFIMFHVFLCFVSYLFAFLVLSRFVMLFLILSYSFSFRYMFIVLSRSLSLFPVPSRFVLFFLFSFCFMLSEFLSHFHLLSCSSSISPIVSHSGCYFPCGFCLFMMCLVLSRFVSCPFF